MAAANWAFRQVFGDREGVDDPSEEDLISALQFDDTGDYLATGDRGGRVVIFESSDATKVRPSEPSSDVQTRGLEYKFHTEFQSHDPEFDYLKSTEIEERVNQIKWRRARSGPLFLLSTNDKTIKLWKIFDKKVRMISSKNIEQLDGQDGSTFVSQLRMPTLQPVQNLPVASLKRTFGNGHAYHINSLSFCSDGETFLSADDLQLNIWSLHTNLTTFNYLDLKPDDMDDLSEVITSAQYHPIDASTMVYSNTKGWARLCDMRIRARCGRGAGIAFRHSTVSSGERSFFSEVTSSISSVEFSSDGRYIMARDYMRLHIWDVKMQKTPMKSIKVHEHLQSKLCELYESDCIFDKFDCSWGPGDQHVCTGTYDNRLLLWDVVGNGSQQLDCVCSVSPSKKTGIKGKLGISSRKSAPSSSPNFNKKIQHHAHHPNSKLLAIAASTSLYIFSA